MSYPSGGMSLAAYTSRGASAPVEAELQQVGPDAGEATVPLFRGGGGGGAPPENTIFTAKNFWRAAVVVLLLALLGLLIWNSVIGQRTFHNLNNLPSPSGAPVNSCLLVNNTQLPLTITEDGVCIELAEDLVFNSTQGGAAITWFGLDGRIRTAGHHFSITGATRSLRCRSQGLLNLDDFSTVNAEQQYADLNRGIQVDPGCRVVVDNVYCDGVSKCVANFGEIIVRDSYTARGVSDRQAEERAVSSFDPVGIMCQINSITVVNNLVVEFEQINNGSVTSSTQPSYTRGVFSTFTPFFFPVAFTAKPFIQINTAAIRAHAGIDLLPGLAATVQSVSVQVLPVELNEGDERDEFTYPVGVRVGAGEATAQITIENLEVDMTAMTNSTESAGVLISASSGVSVDNVNIYGSSYLSTSEYPLLLPRYRQLGLIAVAPLGNTSGGTLVIGQTEHLSPLRFSNVKLEAYDNATYCFQVLSDSVLNYFERDINVSVTVTDGSVVGGAVGALIGAQSKTSAVFRNVDFSLSYYGAYLNNGSSGVDFMDCTFTKHCIGIYMGGDASDAYANGVFSGNSVALEMYGDYYSVGNADILSETGDECPEAPYIYDSDQYDWVFKRRSLRDEEEEPSTRDVPIVEF